MCIAYHIAFRLDEVAGAEGEDVGPRAREGRDGGRERRRHAAGHELAVGPGDRWVRERLVDEVLWVALEGTLTLTNIPE